MKRNLLNKEGPTTLQLSETRCGLCQYHDQTMLRSGRHPIYEHFCTHPESGQSAYESRHNAGREIGRDDITPGWCPYIKAPALTQALDEIQGEVIE